MNNLYQKHHGLPGIGVTAPDGAQGKRGKNILIGFVNDFFDTYELPVGTFVKMAKRKNTSDIFNKDIRGYSTHTKGNEYDTIVDKFAKYLAELNRLSADQIGFSALMTDTMEAFEKFIKERYNSKSDDIYYTGRYFDKDYYEKYVGETVQDPSIFIYQGNQAIEDSYIDVAEDYFLSSGVFKVNENRQIVSTYFENKGEESKTYIATEDEKMLNIPQDTYVWHGKVSDQKQYLENYLYKEGTTIPALDVSVSLDPKDTTTYSMTYDIDDVIYEKGKYSAYQKFETLQNELLSDVDSKDFPNNENSNLLMELALSNGFDRDLTTYYQTIYNDIAKQTPFNNSLYFKETPEDTQFEYANGKDTEVQKLVLNDKAFGVRNYVTISNIESGEHVKHTILSINNSDDASRKYVDFANDKFQQLAYVLKRSMKINVNDLDDYYNGVKGSTNSKYNEYVIDDENNIFVGFDYYGDDKLSALLEKSQNKIDYNELMSVVKNLLLYEKFSMDTFEEVIEDYVEGINVELDYIGKNGKVKDNFVRWYEDDVKVITMPTTLKSDIQTGDTIYFYTNENDKRIEWMVTITEDMKGCTLDQLLQYASRQVSEPFNYQNIFSDDDYNRVQAFEKCNIVRMDNDGVSSTLNDYDVRSQSNILSNVDKAQLYISTVSNDANAHLVEMDAQQMDGAVKTLTIDSTLDEYTKEINYALSSSQPIKVSSLYAQKSSLSNFEMNDILFDNNIILYDGQVATMDAGDIMDTEILGKPNTLTYNMKRSNFFNDGVTFGEYAYGYIIYYGDNIRQYDTSASSLVMKVCPRTDIGDKSNSLSITYNILFYVRNTKGMTYYSKLQRLKATLNSSNRNDIQEYSLTIVGEDTSLSQDKLVDDENISIEMSGLSCEQLQSPIENAIVVTSIDENVVIDSVTFNQVEMKDATKAYSNTWISIKQNNTSVVKDHTYGYDITSMSDNIPDVDGIITTTTDDYMKSFSGTRLFTNLSAKKKANANKERRVLVSVAYTKTYTDESGAVKQSSGTAYKYLTQPGFTDPRTIPSVELNIHNDLLTMEQCNNSDNGVLSNQVQFFMDIDVKDFGYDNWGKYIKNMDDLTLDLTIKNIDQDIDFINKYNANITEYTKRSTIKIIDETRQTMAFNRTNLMRNALRNYVRVYASVLDRDVDDVRNMSDNELSKKELSNDNIYITHKPSYMQSNVGELTKDNLIWIDKSPCVFIDNVTSNVLVNPYDPTTSTIYRGINDYMEIHLNKLTISDVQKPFKVRVYFEFGNPELANLYIRFAVTDICVTYKGVSFTTSYDKGGSSYLCNMDGNNKIKFTYCSNAFDAMVNPVSLTMCPESEEANMMYIYGNVKKVGDEDNIKIKGEFYRQDIYDSSIVGIDVITQRDGQRLSWDNLAIKSKFFQDNIKDIEIKPLSLDNYLDNDTISIKDNLFLQDEKSKSDDKQLSVYDNQTLKSIANNNYLSITYRSSIMNPKLRDDQYTFYYNDKEYLKSKYDQFANNLPMFISESVSINVRDDMMSKSIDTWNFEYQNATRKLMDDTFDGVINTYGNGYMYLNDDIDQQQYDAKEAYSLEETKKRGNEILTSYSKVDVIGTPYKITDATPDKKRYYRSFLYNAYWEYPVYNGNGKIYPYQIVSAFDYVATHKNNYNDQVSKRYADTLALKNDRMIPYNLVYGIYPRCLYNDEYDTLNVLMLRKPSSGSDSLQMDTSTYNIDDDGNIKDWNLVDKHIYVNNRYFLLQEGQYIDDLDFENGYDI